MHYASINLINFSSMYVSFPFQVGLCTCMLFCRVNALGPFWALSEIVNRLTIFVACSAVAIWKNGSMGLWSFWLVKGGRWSNCWPPFGTNLFCYILLWRLFGTLEEAITINLLHLIESAIEEAGHGGVTRPIYTLYILSANIVCFVGNELHYTSTWKQGYVVI